MFECVVLVCFGCVGIGDCSCCWCCVVFGCCVDVEWFVCDGQVLLVLVWVWYVQQVQFIDLVECVVEIGECVDDWCFVDFLVFDLVLWQMCFD